MSKHARVRYRRRCVVAVAVRWLAFALPAAAPTAAGVEPHEQHYRSADA